MVNVCVKNSYEAIIKPTTDILEFRVQSSKCKEHLYGARKTTNNLSLPHNLSLPLRGACLQPDQRSLVFHRQGRR